MSEKKPSNDAKAVDHMDAFVKPWVKAAESYWGKVFENFTQDDAVADWSGHRLNEIAEMRVQLNNVMERQLSAMDMPTRADIDALAEDIADLRRQVSKLDRKLHEKD